MSASIKRPTVGQIVTLLSKLSPDAPFRIEDADTSWTIEVVHVSQDDDGTVGFSGKYDEMT